MERITDIHTHILYGVDDGAHSIEDSIRILKEEYEQGVRNVILTPHYRNGEYKVSTTKIKEHFGVLKEEAGKHFPDMKLVLGQEILAFPGVTKELENGKALTMADSRYVLIEFDIDVDYSRLEKYVQELLLGGYTPIIAHCERYRCLRKVLGNADIGKITHIVEMGSYLQVNADSVYKKDKKFVRELMDNELLHFIGSDAHNLSDRGVYFDRCIKYLNKKYNSEYIQWLLEKNPEKVINNRYI